MRSSTHRFRSTPEIPLHVALVCFEGRSKPNFVLLAIDTASKFFTAFNL